MVTNDCIDKAALDAVPNTDGIVLVSGEQQPKNDGQEVVRDEGRGSFF